MYRNGLNDFKLDNSTRTQQSIKTFVSSADSYKIGLSDQMQDYNSDKENIKPINK